MIAKPATLDDLVREHGPFVYAAAKRMSARWPSISHQDHAQAGFIGLMDAWHRWEPTHEASFRTFASYRVYGEMADAARLHTQSRRAQRVVRSLHESERLYGAAMQVADLSVDVAEEATDHIIGRQAARVILGLPPKSRAAALLYYWTPLTMKQVGVQLGVSESRVCQILKAVTEQLRNILGVQVSAA